jgi:hypothetical protein
MMLYIDGKDMVKESFQIQELLCCFKIYLIFNHIVPHHVVKKKKKKIVKFVCKPSILKNKIFFKKSMIVRRI